MGELVASALTAAGQGPRDSEKVSLECQRDLIKSTIYVKILTM